MAKRPSFQFYPGDWRRDTALQSVSLAARGLWIELMCLMHDGEPYGHLAVNGQPIPPVRVARMVGVHPRTYRTLLDELVRAGVAEVGSNGADKGLILSRRMVRDRLLSETRAASGAKGAAVTNQQLNPQNGVAVAADVAGFAGDFAAAKSRQMVATATADSSCSSGVGGVGEGGGAPHDVAFPDDAHREAYRALRRSCHHPPSFDAAIGGLLQGLTDRPFTPAQIGSGLMDMAAKGVQPSPSAVRRFAQFARNAEGVPEATPRNTVTASGNPFADYAKVLEAQEARSATT